MENYQPTDQPAHQSTLQPAFHICFACWKTQIAVTPTGNCPRCGSDKIDPFPDYPVALTTNLGETAVNPRPQNDFNLHESTEYTELQHCPLTLPEFEKQYLASFGWGERRVVPTNPT